MGRRAAQQFGLQRARAGEQAMQRWDAVNVAGRLQAQGPALIPICQAHQTCSGADPITVCPK
jgi:hypothetical protein